MSGEGGGLAVALRVTYAGATALLLALAVSGCPLRESCHPVGASGASLASVSAPAASAGAAPSASASAASPVRAGDWREALRNFDWRAAASALDALPDGERLAPEARFARARIAVELGDPARAVALLSELERDLPLLAEEIAEHRAKAQLAAGRYEAAAAHYAKRSDAAGALASARALEGLGQLDRAREAADRGLQRLLADRRPEGAQAEVRALRARLAAAARDRKQAAAIYRWLAVHTPTSPHADGADEKLAELAPDQALTRAERLERALILAREGRVEATETELERLAAAKGAPVPPAEVLIARGLARYGARRELELAAELFTQAAALDPARRPRALLYQARALTRAHETRRAVEQYRALVARHATAPEAAEARFQIGRLSYIRGAWGEAITAYGAYLARHGQRGEFATSARYERAVAWLIIGQPARAERAFAELIAGQRDELLRASYRELRAVALLGAGQRKAAETELRAVIADEPLSLASLFATARLTALGVAPPAPIPPPAAEAPLPALGISLSPKAALYHRLGLDGDAERELAAQEASLRRNFGPRGDEAICAAYAELSVAGARYAAGRRAARWQTVRAAPTARSRWLWDCLYPRPYAALVASASLAERLPEHLMHAVMRQESAFSPTVESPARAVGLMQLIPPTAAAVAAELSLPYDPQQLRTPAYNVKLGARYLRRVLERFGERPALAVAAYNAGPGAVSTWLESGEALPLDLFVARIPYTETRVYVHRVLGNLARYQYLAGGAAAVASIDLEVPRGKRAAPTDF